MTMRIIQTDACIAEGLAALSIAEPRFAMAAAQAGPIPLRRREGGYEALLSAIVSQQISVAAAAGIWGRLKAAGAATPGGLRAMDDDALRACGLSRPKVRYARGLADADLDYAALVHMPDAEATAALTALPGIGQWTAEIYLMFSLGRSDVFASGDLALQESARMLFGLEDRPKPKAFAAMAADWAPWRAVAARVLWAWYHVAKGREGIR